MATSYAKQRSTFGRPLADRQAIQWKLAHMYIELQAARLLVYKAATRLDAGEDAREDCYVCKYYADEMAFRAADECMQIHGGIALTTDLPIEKLWRQQRSYRITEGASEVMMMVIARHVLKTYGCRPSRLMEIEPAQLERYIRTDYDRWIKIIKDAGITLD